MNNNNNSLTGFPLLICTIALCLSNLLTVLDYSIANVAIPYIAGDLGVSSNQGTYVITSFAVGNAIVLPMTGWLTKRIGLVRLVYLSAIGFVFFSWICGMSPTLTILVAARFFQGVAAGPLVPAAQSLLITVFPSAKKGTAMMLWSTIVIVGPILGPILGGWITYNFHWSWIFFINIPLGLISAAIIHAHLKSYETEIEKPKSDWIGLFLLAIGVSTLQFLLDKGEQFDWLNSSIIRTCIVTSVICFTYLIAYELYKKNPLLELRLFKVRSFALSVGLLATQYAIYFGSIVIVPLWLQTYMGYIPTWAGIAVAPIGILPLLFSWAVADFAKKVGNIIPLAISLIMFSLSCFVTAYFTTQVDLFHIMWTRFLFGFGVLFFLVPLFALSVRDIPDENLPQATGIFHFVRAMMGGVGTATFTTLWIRRSAFHHANIVSTIVPPNLPADAYYNTLDTLGFSQMQAQEFVNTEATSQAALLGMNDIFYLMGWIFLATIAILVIGKRRRKPKHDDIYNSPTPHLGTHRRPSH